MGKLILRHFLIWLMLSIGYFFLAEPLVKILLPEFHDVEIWLIFEIVGLAFILLTITSVLIINIVRHQRRINASS